ncbi:hypothetical protein D9M71_723100 [compost metagenome]
MYCGFDYRVERIQPFLRVVMDLPDQNQRIAHQDARQRDQPDQGVDTKRLLEDQQCRHHANQSQRRGEEHHDHRRDRTYLQNNDQQRQGNHDRDQRHYRLTSLARLLDCTGLLDPIPVRQLVDDRLQFLRDHARDVRRL